MGFGAGRSNTWAMWAILKSMAPAGCRFFMAPNIWGGVPKWDPNFGSYPCGCAGRFAICKASSGPKP